VNEVGEDKEVEGGAIKERGEKREEGGGGRVRRRGGSVRTKWNG